MRDVPRGLAVGTRWMPGEYAMPPRAMARRLIGAVLARRLDDGTVLRSVIVETEAYLGAVDQASHARNGRRTARTEPMYMRGGFSYVYFTYGMHFCFNVVCDRAGVAGAVLVRALMPMGTPEQLRLMAANRGFKGGLKGGVKAGWKVRDLCRGPARLCRALRIDGALNAVDMTTSEDLWIEEGDAGMLVDACGGGGGGLRDVPRIVRSARIGVEGAGKEWASKPLRWFVRGSGFVSGTRAVNGG